jgi:hypothetical protein
MRVAAAEAAIAAWGFRPGFVDGEAAASDLACVQLANRGLRVVVATHLDKREAARATRRLIAHDSDRFDGSGAREQFLQLRFANFVGQVSDVQLSTHNTHSSVAIATFPHIERCWVDVVS